MFFNVSAVIHNHRKTYFRTKTRHKMKKNYLMQKIGQVLLLTIGCFLTGNELRAQSNCVNVQSGTTNIGGVINSYFLPSNATVAVGATSLSIAAGTQLGASGAITGGDLLLIIQMQDGVGTDFTNAATYGTVPGTTRAGQYEFVVATNAVTQTAGGTLNFRRANGTTGGLVNQYIQNPTNASGRQTFQVVKVPNYTNVLLVSTVTASNWEGNRGGIVALRVTGNTDFNSSFGINVAMLGFRGAGSNAVSGANAGAQFRDVSTLNTGSSKGEGICGTPSRVVGIRGVANTPTTTGVDYPNGGYMTGAPGNGGGGGKDSGPNAGICNYNSGGTNTSDFNSGGGGGSNAGTGGHGGRCWCTGSNLWGLGGYSLNALSGRMIMGGGGGAGESQSETNSSYGGYGGGMVFFFTGTVSNTNTNTVITANGDNANRSSFTLGATTIPVNALQNGGGGGGAGGSIYAYASGGSLGALVLTANGGDGGNVRSASTPNFSPTQSPNDQHGPGGGAGGGKIYNTTTTGAVTVAAGVAGHFYNSATGSIVDHGTFGATDGATGTITTSSATTVLSACISIAGNVLNDVDGLSDNMVDGTGINPGGLYAVLYDVTTGAVVDTALIAADGTYSFGAAPGDNYTVVLTTTPPAIGSVTLPATSLPSGWGSTGEYLGTGTGSDGTPNGVLSLGTVNAPLTDANFGISVPGYIYVHKKTLNEESSVNFSFNGTGGIGGFTLNDVPGFLNIIDIGASSNGRLWAIAGTGVAPTSGSIYYRDKGSSTWTLVPGSPTDVTSIDAGASISAVYTQASGAVSVYTGSGHGSQAVSGIDVAYDRLNDRIIRINNSGNTIHYKPALSGSWTTISGPLANRIDVLPNGNLLLMGTDNNVYVFTIAGAQVGSTMTKPAGTITGTDVAAADDGTIFAIFDNFVYRWTGSAWVQEPKGRLMNRITGGPAGQAWTRTINNVSGNNARTIWTRTYNGDWIDDERVRAANVDNSTVLQAMPGLYTITETVPGGWALQRIATYDPTGNTTVNLPASSASVNLAANEMVHLIYTNTLLQSAAAVNDCSSFSFSENFGTGTAGVNEGGPLTGYTDYHWVGSANIPIGGTDRTVDGYYAVISRSQDAAFSSPNQFDHTTGNGTGRFLLVNANYDANTFYQRRITGLIPGVQYTLSYWVTDISPAASLRPNILAEISDPATDSTLASGSTGPVTTGAAWVNKTLTFTATQSAIDLRLKNNGIGGSGNDLGIDDITFKITAPAPPVTVKPAGGTCATGGTITVLSPIGSIYEYSKDGVNYQSGVTFSNLAPGIYTITARYVGSVNCTSSKTDTIAPAICGTIFNDVNGLSDNTVNGTGTNAGGFMVVLINNTTGLVVDSVLANPDGTYTFPDVASGSYSIMITDDNTPVTIGAAPPASPTMPPGWVITGENLGAGAGNDGLPNGRINIGTVTPTANVTNVNFGIEQPPTANSATVPGQPNPGGTVSVTVPPATFGGTDPAGGVIDSIAITSFPTNATSITVGTTTYYPNAGAIPGTCPTATCAVFPAGGLSIPTNASGIPTQAISVDPVNGIVTVHIPYVTVDNAGVRSPVPGSADVPFGTITLAGNVFDDNDGMRDGIVDGGPANPPVFVNLVDPATNTVITSVPANADGTYSLPVNPSTTYNIILTSNAQTPGNVLTTSTLPNGWATTGEGAVPAGDGVPNGIINVTTGTTNTTGVNFGVEQPPTANTTTAPGQVNPGGTNSVTVPAATFGGTDPDGIVDSLIITAFPPNATTITINGTTYTPGSFPPGGVTVPTNTSGQPTQPISVDPVNGSVTVSIPYRTIDEAGVRSTVPGTASLPFGTISIGGTVFNDANGLTDNTVNGTGTNAGGINAVLIDNATGLVVATVPVAANGAYSFTGIDAGNYNIEITTNTATVGAAPPAVALPAGWVTTGEHLGAGSGTDGTPNGILPVGPVSANTTAANFGIEQPPTAATNTTPTQTNPGGTTSVTVPPATFGGTDPDGNIDSLIITAFPPNATTITINGTTYTPGSFPPGGVHIPAPGGMPAQLISVDPVDGAVTVSIPYKTIDNAGVQSTTPGTASLPFGTITISGTLFDDANGLKDNTVNGTGTNAGGINAVLIDNNTGLVVAVVPVAANGAYSFPGINAGNYNIGITTNTATVGTAAPPVALPTNWLTTGEHVGAGVGDDGIPNSVIQLGPVSDNTTAVNFGIEQMPAANTTTTPGQMNPGGTTSVTVPPATFGGTDPDGTVDSLIITAFPPNATTITVNGVTYTPSDPVWGSGGIHIPAPGGVPSWPISVDPTDGAVTVSIPYITIDNAGVQSPTPGAANVIFTVPLPVTLTDFTATLQDRNVAVRWTTAGIQPGTRFELQHGPDGKSWAPLAVVSDEQNFTYLHLQPGYGDHYYRLKITDGGQATGYSRTAVVHINGKGVAVTVAPNPTNSLTTVSVSDASSIYEVCLTDLSGRVLQTQQIQGGVPVQFDMTRYPDAIYFLQVTAHGTGQVADRMKLIKQ